MASLRLQICVRLLEYYLTYSVCVQYVLCLNARCTSIRTSLLQCLLLSPLLFGRSALDFSPMIIASGSVQMLSTFPLGLKAQRDCASRMFVKQTSFGDCSIRSRHKKYIHRNPLSSSHRRDTQATSYHRDIHNNHLLIRPPADLSLSCVGARHS